MNDPNLYEIDSSIRKNLKDKTHAQAPLYLDYRFLLSLKIKNDKKEELKQSKFTYYSKLYGRNENYIVVSESSAKFLQDD